MWKVGIIIAFILPHYRSLPQLLTASEYTNTTLRYLHKDSDLRAVVAKGFESPFKQADTQFLTVGLESSGHHLIESLSKVLPQSRRNTGGQKSFPQNNCKRKHLDAAECSPALTMNHWKEKKYLVILRSPLPQFKSVLSRFWGTSPTLSEMYDMWLSAASQMHIFVTGLIALDKPLFVVVYENLLNNPAAHVDVFTTFLNCNRSAIETWVGSFHAPSKKTDTERVLKMHSWGRWKKPERKGYEKALDAHFNKQFDIQTLYNAFPRYEANRSSVFG